MKKFKFYLHLLRTGALSIRKSYIYIYMIFVMCFINDQRAFAQCGMSDDYMPVYPSPLPNCELGSFKCLKIKFHWINNTNGPMSSPSDIAFKGILDQINLNFSPGNIQFSFSNECIHKATIPGAGDHNLEAGLNIDPVTLEAEPEVEPYYFKKEYINVYFYQQHPGNGRDGYSWGQFDSKNEYIFSVFDAKVLTHELGHTLSLYHTRANTDFENKSTWECKSGSATLADMIEDTGGDPYNMDLDENMLRDGVQWVNENCNYNNLVHSYSDECDNSGPWNIPKDNFMFWDERRSCWNRFTPCQFSAMHSEILDNLQNFTTDCGPQNNPTLPCADIVINSFVTWTNEVKNLCANQKIIITANGHLNLVNTILTKAIQNTSCPELSGNWDGIFIEGGNGISYPGGPNLPSGGSLTATSGSIIEYSNHAIQADKGHLGITLSNCTLRLNPMAIHASGPGGLIYGGSINLSSCTISNTSVAVKPNLILANGCNVNITGSTLTNMSSSEVTGIKAYNNRVSVKSGSTIQGFKYGVDKEMSGNLAGLMGLHIENSKFLDGTNSNHTSIRNRGGSISAKRNWFGGKIDVAGQCNGNWYGNNFRKIVEIFNPSIAHRFLENNFFESRLELIKDHSLTDAMCNIFEQTSTAVNGNLSQIKSQWGSIDLSSGNKPLVLNSQPTMEAIGTSNSIKHFHWAPSGTSAPFDYAGKFSGSGSALAENINCLYNVFPTSIIGTNDSISNSYSDSENHEWWYNLNLQYQNLISHLPQAPIDSIPIIHSQIENIEIDMQLSVLLALDNSQELTSTSCDLWVSRADEIYDIYGQMLTLFNQDSLSQLVNYLNGLELTGEDSVDRSNLISSIEWIQTLVSQDKNIYLLDSFDLDTLTSMANLSFGNFTTLIRSFLNIYYNIRIDPPNELNENNRKDFIRNKISLNQFTIVPNPVDNCFEIKSHLGVQPILHLKITDLNGTLFYQQSGKNIRVCTDHIISPGVYLLHILADNTDHLEHLKFIKF